MSRPDKIEKAAKAAFSVLGTPLNGRERAIPLLCAWRATSPAPAQCCKSATPARHLIPPTGRRSPTGSHRSAGEQGGDARPVDGLEVGCPHQQQSLHRQAPEVKPDAEARHRQEGRIVAGKQVDDPLRPQIERDHATQCHQQGDPQRQVAHPQHSLPVARPRVEAGDGLYAHGDPLEDELRYS